MHEETYPDFFTPRDEKPSLLSSEEKSSEFDWLERKRTRRQKYEGKIEQVLCIFIYLTYTKGCLQEPGIEKSGNIADISKKYRILVVTETIIATDYRAVVFFSLAQKSWI